MTTTAAVEKNNQWYHRNFELLEKSLNGESKSALHQVRKNALERFLKLGFPTSRNEEWRFTNIAPIRNSEFKPVLKLADDGIGKSDVEKLFVTGTKSPKLVFINGLFSRHLSSVPAFTPKVKFASLSAAMKNADPSISRHLARYAETENSAFIALNTAFVVDGAFLQVGDSVELDEPVECLYLTSSVERLLIANPRNLFIIGNDSRVTIVESFYGLGQNAYFNNAVTEIVVGERSTVEHDKLELEGSKGYHIGTIQIRQEAESKYTNNLIALGGSIIRNNVTAVLAAERAECTLNGLSVATEEQLIDNHTTIDHTKPNCTSHELYKSILDGKSKGVFNGKIFVRKDAQKTDAKQTNKTLLLSDDATIDTKPQLEIFADDVKCTHGATVGQLDEEQVFYLRSRGISERAARDILTFAFASNVVERVHSEILKEKLHVLLQNRLDEGRRLR